MMKSSSGKSKYIKPLDYVENHFLEVLITNFSLERRGNGCELRIKFNVDTPAIWGREGKHEICRKVPDFKRKAKKYQGELDDFLINRKGDNCYQFNDKKFPFRYASGGTLPIVRWGGKEYYCFIYREVFPAGWNIVNGGCDNRAELLNPLITIERELCEELIAFNPKDKKRYVLSEFVNRPIDRPEFAIAQRIWDERFVNLGYPDFRNLQEIEIPLKWLPGPDSVVVEFANESPKRISDIFLNINAEDFGIEVDKVAIISLDQNAILCDGELFRGDYGNTLVNAPVGLFLMDKLNRGIKYGLVEYIPDIFFFNAQRYDGKQFKEVVKNVYLPYAKSTGRLVDKDFNYFQNLKAKFDLCPVTRRIVWRYLELQGRKDITNEQPVDIFICFGGEDENFAEKVYKFLQSKIDRRIFFSKESRDPAFIPVINSALESAQLLLAVATNPQNLLRPYPRYEYTCFFNDMLGGRKPENARLISFISSSFKPLDLPKPLCIYQTIMYDPQYSEMGLEELAKYIAECLEQLGH